MGKVHAFKCLGVDTENLNTIGDFFKKAGFNVEIASDESKDCAGPNTILLKVSSPAEETEEMASMLQTFQSVRQHVSDFARKVIPL